MVLADCQVLWTDAHLILEEILVFIHRLVLVHVFHVGSGLIGCGITLVALAGVRRVAFYTVDALVAFQNRGLTAVEVAAAEVMVVVAGGVGHD